MYKIIAELLSSALGALRFRWHGLAFAWLVCVAGWVGVSAIPDSYESEAVLYIDTATVLQPLLADLAVNTNVMSEVRMMTEVLLSRPQLERVARDTDLDLRAKGPEEMEELLAYLKRRIMVSGGAGTAGYSDNNNMYTIRFYDQDPQMVYAVVQSLLNSFVEKSLGQNKADSAGAQLFIEEQIQQYEVRLGEAEQQLADFKKRNVGLMPSEGQDYYSRLQLALEELDKVKAEYNKIASRRNELQRQMEGETPTFGLLATPDKPKRSDGAISLDPVEAYEKELAELLLKYTEKHPKVIALQERITQMRLQRSQRSPQGDDQPTYELDTELVNMNSLDLNPVYQSLKIAISQANADLSEATEQVAAAEDRVAYLRKMVDTIPEIEAQLARLNRDYEVNKTQHTALLKRLESARLSEEAEFRNDEIKFRIIEPPVVPLKPIGPNRYLFATVVLIAGFVCGGALSYLLNLINPVFNSIEAISAELGLPVLGSISQYMTRAQVRQNRRGNRRFGLAAAALIGFYVLALFFWPATNLIKSSIENGGVMM